ncbi:MAG TPA: carboxyl transferase domain-containing protein [Actinomycetota bacterium]|nr:carboxyl transferase domain-containing protein [Actinomycetota bacterium]
MPAISARERIASLFDSFASFDHELTAEDPISFPGYPSERESAATQTGESEAVVTGVATIGDRQMVAAVFEFGFMGGSMSRAVGDRIEKAMEEAEQRRISFLAVTSSGGARMQEGMAALSQMPRTVAASARLAKAGIPRIAILCHPTTGGAYASFASLSDFIAAEKGATIGFAGPRVVEAMTGAELPQGSHTAEEALKFGLVDSVLEANQMKPWLASLLSILARSETGGAGSPNAATSPGSPRSAWDLYQSIRSEDRPGPGAFLEAISEEMFVLHGDRMGSDDPAISIGLAQASGQRFCFVTMGRGNPTASGFRKARRAIDLAGRLDLPLVTAIDTSGADPSHSSEYSGLAGEIARTFEAMIACPSRTVCLVSGEGGSGGALALAPADVLVMHEESVFSVIAPEGAAAILYRDATRAPEVAEALRPTPQDLQSLGIIDAVVRGRDAGWLGPALAGPPLTARRTQRFKSA